MLEWKRRYVMRMSRFWGGLDEVRSYHHKIIEAMMYRAEVGGVLICFSFNAFSAVSRNSNNQDLIISLLSYGEK